MKKLLVFALVAIMSMGLVACGGKDAEDDVTAVTEDAATQEDAATTEEDVATEDVSTEDAATEDAVAEDAATGETKEVTINLMGNDVPATVTIADGKFEASYSFNGNEIVAKGTVEADGSFTLEEYTPETVPAEYVQAALTSIADEL